MAVVNYHSVNGRIRGQSTAGVRTDYLTDALGSVVATVNSSAQVVNTYRYKPYGERLAKTGAGADPRFQWTGQSGSRTTGLSFAEQYIRARHYGSSQSQRTTVDPLWPAEPAFGFAGQSPATFTDSTGLFRVNKVNICGRIGVFQIIPGRSDALSVASGIGRSPSTLSGEAAIAYCKPAFPNYRGSTLVVNGSLFETAKGRPLDPVKDCLNKMSEGIDLAEPSKGVQYVFGSGYVIARRLFESTGECAISLVPKAKIRTARVIVYRTDDGDAIYVIPPSPGMTAKEMCACFPYYSGGPDFAKPYHLDGGSSTQIFYQGQEGAPIQQLCCDGSRDVNNWLWLRTRIEPAPT